MASKKEIEELILPEQEIVENIGTKASDISTASEEKQISLEYLQRIDSKLNKVLKVMNLEV